MCFEKAVDPMDKFSQGVRRQLKRIYLVSVSKNRKNNYFICMIKYLKFILEKTLKMRIFD